MPAFSFSAPRFTEEDERREQATLSEDEKTRIRDDLHGKTTFVETDEMMTSGQVNLERELLRIPPEEKGAYLEALARCPDLVSSESNPIAFLRGRDYDSAAAAKSIVSYWEGRKSLFADHTFRPMTISGALRDDLDTLQLGVFELLPDDTEGRAVLYFEKGRLPKSYSRPSLQRVYFYLMNAALKKESAQKNGLICIASNSSRFHSFDRKLLMSLITLTKNCFPIKPRACHFCFVFRSSFFETTVMPVIKHMLGQETRRRLIIHTGTEEHVMASLQKYGLTRESVPKKFGGIANLEGFHASLNDLP